MALSRSPIKLPNKASAIISLRNVMSILLLERISNTIKARSYSTFWTDHEKAGYMSASQGYFLINDLKKGIFPCLGVGFYNIQGKTYLHKGGNDA